MAKISRDVRSFLIIAIIVVVLGVSIVALIAKTTSGKSWTEMNDPTINVTVHFLDTDKYVDFDNVVVVEKVGYAKWILLPDGQRIYLTNAEVLIRDKNYGG